MKQVLFFMSFILVTFPGISQTQTVLNEYTSPISNTHYKIGDTLVIGEPNYIRNDNFLYTNLFIAQKGMASYGRLNEKLSNKKVVIKHIYSNQEHSQDEFEHSVVFEVELEGHSDIFIPIDKSILSKEVVVFPYSRSTLKHLPFNTQTATILQIKAKKLSPETAMLTYIEKLEPQKFEEWKGNEFLYQDEKEQYIREVDSVLEIVNIGDTLVLILPVEIGDYNFDSNSFPVVETHTKFGETVEFLFSDEIFTFKNYSKFSSISVPRNKAEYLANSSKKSYNGTRSAFVILKVKAPDIVFSERNGSMNIGSNVRTIIEFSFTIVEMDCVDSEALYYNYLGGR